MKKLISLFAAVSMLSLSAAAVQAADLENYIPTDDKYSIEYEVGAENAGAYYGMVAVSGTGTNIDTTNVDNYVYIDQATADAEGKISFSGFAPKGVAASDENYTESTVFIGGAGYTTAQAIGVLRKANWEDAPSTIIISGSVIDTFAKDKLAKIIVQDAEENVIAQADANADGTYAITVDPAATYDIVLTKDGFLKFTITGVPATANLALDAVTITDLSGDVSGNNQVMLEDLSAVLNNYTLAASAAADPNADVSGNGQIMLEDLSAVLNHYTNKGITQVYSAE